jgi:hypothetical protein
VLRDQGYHTSLEAVRDGGMVIRREVLKRVEKETYSSVTSSTKEPR